MLSQFQSATNWSSDTSISDDIKVIEAGLYYNASLNLSPTLIFSLNGGLEVEIPADDLVGPVRGLNKSGARVLQNNITVVNIFNESAPEGTATLGKSFLSQVRFIPLERLPLLIKFLRCIYLSITLSNYFN